MRIVHAAAIAAVGAFVLASCDQRREPAPAVPPSATPARAAAASAAPAHAAKARAEDKQTLASIAPSPVDDSDKQKSSPCPAGMVLVDGMYCPKVKETCLHWMDPPGRYHKFRCAEYKKPTRCLSKHRVHLRFCIDKYEYTPPGQDLPANHQSWTMAYKKCKSLGERVCMESEYNFACEGEQMRPYPYGWKRDSTACNADHFDVVDSHGKLRDMRAGKGEYPRCVSPFGVHDLAGNLEEFVSIDGTDPVRPAMKGAYWQPSRNNCRAAQTAHDRYYNGTETGFRCCADPSDGVSRL